MKARTLILRAVIVLIGIGALGFLLIEPHFEGRNAHATPFEIYFKDPFLAIMYVASIPFFMGLYFAFKALGHPERRLFWHIKHCAIGFMGFVAGGEIFILFSDSDDRAGGVFIGGVLFIASAAVATAAAILERRMTLTADS